jgi:O-acetyl-ADP-ribose deacetylase (regulator of RNase III)
MEEKIQINGTSVSIVKDDLTMMDVEAIVFYANKELSLGSGYGNAISTRGGPSIKKELEQFPKPDITDVVVSAAGILKAKKILHAVGPAFQEEGTEVKLSKTIENALKTADNQNIKQIAFPIMGSGFYGIPADKAVKIMFETTKKYLKNSTAVKEIIFCGNDNREFRFLSSGFDQLK